MFIDSIRRVIIAGKLMLVPLVFESDCGVNIPHPNIHDNCRIMIFWPTVLRQWIM